MKDEFTNQKARSTPWRIKLSNAKDKEILKAARGKVTYHIKGSFIKLSSANFSAEMVRIAVSDLQTGGVGTG